MRAMEARATTAMMGPWLFAQPWGWNCLRGRWARSASSVDVASEPRQVFYSRHYLRQVPMVPQWPPVLVMGTLSRLTQLVLRASQGVVETPLVRLGRASSCSRRCAYPHHWPAPCSAHLCANVSHGLGGQASDRDAFGVPKTGRTQQLALRSTNLHDFRAAHH